MLCTNTARSQEAFTTAGCEAAGIGGTVSSSIGQILSNTYSSNTGTYLTQGIQQSYRIPFAVIAGVGLHVSIYPNPTTNLLFLEVHSFEYVGMHYQLYDPAGQQLENRILSGNQTRIHMGHLVAGTYVLSVMQHGRPVKSFKILKTN